MKDALPQIQLPGGFPAWLVAGHTVTDEIIYSPVEMSSGHKRMRRVYSITPQRRKVSLLLTQEQGQEFFKWFELDILGGGKRFAAKVRALGEDHMWYGAVFADSPPYTAEMAHWGRTEVHWVIEAELLLYGVGSTAPPPMRGFETNIVVPLIASSRQARGYANFETAITVPLVAAGGLPSMAVNITVPLVAGVSALDAIALYTSLTIPLQSEASSTRTTLFATNILVALDGRTR